MLTSSPLLPGAGPAAAQPGPGRAPAPTGGAAAAPSGPSPASFAALLAHAGQEGAGQDGTAGNGPAGNGTVPPGRATAAGARGTPAGGTEAARGTALAGLARDLAALGRGTTGAPAAPGLPGAVLPEVLALLRDFDAATGADALGTLAQGLQALDAEGVARLEAAAGDPAALVAALAELMGLTLPAAPGAPQQAAPHNAAPLAEGGLAHAGPPAVAASAGLAGAAGAPATPAAAGAPAPGAALPGPPAEVATGTTEPAAPFRPAGPEQAMPAAEGTPQASAPKAVAGEARGDLRGALLSAIAAGGDEAAPPLALPEPRVAAAAADAARAADPGPPPASGFARNLALQIRGASFSEGNTRIALSPRGLGEIEIDLRPDEAGRLRIVLRAENPAVLMALRGDREGLLGVLAEGGVGIEDADLSFEDFQGRRHGRGEAEALGGPPAAAAADDDAKDDAGAGTGSQATPHARTDGDGLLDMLT